MIEIPIALLVCYLSLWRISISCKKIDFDNITEWKQNIYSSRANCKWWGVVSFVILYASFFVPILLWIAAIVYAIIMLVDIFSVYAVILALKQTKNELRDDISTKEDFELYLKIEKVSSRIVAGRILESAFFLFIVIDFFVIAKMRS